MNAVCELLARLEEIVQCHPLVELFEDRDDFEQVLNGNMSEMLVVKGTTIHVIYLPRHKTQWLFDSFGEEVD